VSKEERLQANSPRKAQYRDKEPGLLTNVSVV
jgi:hypothetical protein